MKGETDEIPPEMLRARPRTIYVEMTSRCNLLCTYCPVSQPDYKGEDLLMEPEALADVLARAQPDEVQLSGHGETTMLRDWTRVARLLLDRGLTVTITSNFAKRFSDEEIDTLARFRAVKISVDTTDADLQFQLRRGLKLDKLTDNLDRLVAYCEANFIEKPFLHISCTITHLNMPLVPDLVRWTHARKAHALALVNLVRHPDVEGAVKILHPSEVDPLGALRAIDEAQIIADELGVRFDMEPGLVDSLEVGQTWQ
ncbi:MAG: radical SAM protein [Planctomycetia bacterium]|jgi:MoaA/NifB/PqqE/SkfB family radical SAM enzyme